MPKSNCRNLSFCYLQRLAVKKRPNLKLTGCWRGYFKITTACNLLHLMTGCKAEDDRKKVVEAITLPWVITNDNSTIAEFCAAVDAKRPSSPKERRPFYSFGALKTG